MCILYTKAMALASHFRRAANVKSEEARALSQGNISACAEEGGFTEGGSGGIHVTVRDIERNSFVHINAL